MKILVAQTAGFCMGVRRAVDLAIDVAKKKSGPVYTLGPLIHNRQTVELLESRGVHEISDHTPAAGSTVLIRAHGVPPDTESRHRSGGHEIIDGTCPKVKTVHKVIARYQSQGYSIIIAGDEGHAEVIGLLGYAAEAGVLVQTPDDIDRLPDMSKVCLVCQTTFDRTLFDAISDRVRARFASSTDVVVKKTICSATDRRQSETEALARQVDAMIVVGGRNSANTMRLVKICRSCRVPTQHVETEREIDLPALAKCASVGVTAGASTPHWMVNRVVDFLQAAPDGRRAGVGYFLRRGAEALVNLNIVVAAGAGAAYYASCVVQGIPLKTTHLALGGMVTFLYFLSMYLWNSLTSIQSTRHLGLSRYAFYRSHARGLALGAGGCMSLILAAAYMGGVPLFLLMLFALAAGTLYHTTIIPPGLGRFTAYRSLQDIPMSRDLFVALAWGTLLVFVPHAIGGSLRPSMATLFAFVWISLFALLRSVIVDLRDIEGDRIMGRETLVTILGEARARRFMQLLVAGAGIGLAAVCGVGLFWQPLGISLLWTTQLLVPVYTYLLVRRNRTPFPTVFSILVDAQFFLMGICAFVAQHLFAE